MSRSASARGLHPTAASPNRSTDEFEAAGPYVPGERHIGGRCDTQVRERTEQPYVAIGAEANLREWGPVTALVADAGVGPGTGPGVGRTPFFRYRTIGDEEKRFHLEIGAPFEREISGDGRMRAGRVPAGSYATVVHVGHPDRIGESLDRLEGWIEDRGLKVAQLTWNGQVVWDGCFEFYPTDPAVEPDRERWEIEVAHLRASDAGETQ